MFPETDMMDDVYFQTGVEAEIPPFESGVGGEVGGGVSIDGTPMRVVTLAAIFLGVVIIYHNAKYRFHVTV